MARLSCIVVIISIVLTCIFAEELYSDKYDHVDVHEILANEKLRKEYYNCFMSTAACVTADAKFFNEIIGESIQTKCKKCTEKQKEMLDAVTDWYTKNEPDNWKKFIEKTIEDLKKKNAGQ